MSHPTCSTCTYFALLPGRESAPPVCHRNPPTTVTMGPQKYDPNTGNPIPPDTWSLWTVVRPVDWCGQHRLARAEIPYPTGTVTPLKLT